ncbi:MAG: SGNH/GDSL hydrolase family protein [Xanthobacteraceae bacterium]|jgi:lysophospholipase L1-like esterase
MSPQRARIFACLARAGVASAVFSAVVAARALPTEPGHNVAPALTAPVHPALPNTTTSSPAQPIACSAPAQYAHLDRPLVRTARQLVAGEPLTIVAIGSSSTAGAGASSPDASYPNRLAIELKRRFPTADITVLNRGVNGEETTDMMARFDKDVFAAHPQLVLWQVGTNSVLRDRPLQEHAEQMQRGIDRLKASGADVVLIDLQYSPKVIEASETLDMVDQIAAASKEKNIDLFRRFAQMRDWHDVQHLPFEAFVSPDGLHMNDWGYACWAKILSGAIAEAATRPVASAAAHARPSH